ncbi:OB-fold nucleic acid binding domain-containing protein [Acinetobacter haemolyticus]
MKPWSDEVRLKGEKDTLGLYLTGHPIDVYRQELKAFIPAKLNELTPTRRGVTTVFAGLVVDIANFPNRIMITLDDGTARVEISCNHERFQRYKDIVRLEQVVVVEGEIYEREGYDRPMARLSKAFSLNDIRQKRAQSIQVQLSPDLMTKSLAKDLQTILLPYCNVDMSQHIVYSYKLSKALPMLNYILDRNGKLPLKMNCSLNYVIILEKMLFSSNIK